MLSLYLHYVSSMETGDVEVYKKVYTSFNKAIEDLDETILSYVSDRKAEKNYRIVGKDEFDLRKLKYDNTLPVGSYCFKKKKSSAWIYKKTVLEGRIWNGAKMDKIGKIGVLQEINVPVDTKLINLIRTIQMEAQLEIVGTCTDTDIIKESPVIREQTHDKYVTGVSKPTHYEHGHHVSFIQELKDKLSQKALEKSQEKLESGKITEIPKQEHENEHLCFLNALNEQRTKLVRITPPPSPDNRLGRVLPDPVKDVSGPMADQKDPMADQKDQKDYTDGTEDTEDIAGILPDVPQLEIYDVPEQVPITITISGYSNYNDEEDETDSYWTSEAEQDETDEEESSTQSNESDEEDRNDSRPVYQTEKLFPDERVIIYQNPLYGYSEHQTDPYDYEPLPSEEQYTACRRSSEEYLPDFPDIPYIPYEDLVPGVIAESEETVPLLNSYDNEYLNYHNNDLNYHKATAPVSDNTIENMINDILNMINQTKDETSETLAQIEIDTTNRANSVKYSLDEDVMNLSTPCGSASDLSIKKDLSEFSSDSNYDEYGQIDYTETMQQIDEYYRNFC